MKSTKVQTFGTISESTTHCITASYNIRWATGPRGVKTCLYPLTEAVSRRLVAWTASGKGKEASGRGKRGRVRIQGGGRGPWGACARAQEYVHAWSHHLLMGWATQCNVVLDHGCFMCSFSTSVHWHLRYSP